MSKTIDNKIVEMQFDNKNFERNVDQSMQTLERLKKNLNFEDASKSLESFNEISSNVKLDGIESAAKSLQDRFSTLGIVGMEVLTRLTDYAIEFGGNMFDAVFGKIWNGGKTRAMNIEQAKFQLAGLGVAWQDIVDAINWGVQDTAYSLDAAALVASQLTASGINIGESVKTVHDNLNDIDKDVDRMAISLRAISGVAAMTNSEYSEIGRIFATVAGNGRLMGDQLLQLGSKGLNAAATLANFFNSVADGTANVSDSVAASILEITDGLHVTEKEIRDFTSDSLISFDIFSEAMDEAFGAHAKDANTTLTGVLANINAALSKIGADLWSPIVENGGELVLLLEQIRQKINVVKDAIRDALGWVSNDNGVEYLKEWKDYIDAIFISTRKWVESLNTDHIKEGISTIVQIFRDLFNIIGSSLNVVKNLVSPILQFINKTENSSVFQIILHFIQNITGALANGALAFEEFANHSNGITSYLEKNGENIKKTFEGVFAVLDIGFTIIKSASSFIGTIINSVLSFISPLTSNIWGLTGAIGDFLVSLNEAIKRSNVINAIFEGIGKVLTSVIDLIKSFFGSFSNSNTKNVITFGNVLSSIGNIFSKFADGLSSAKPIFEKVGEIISKIFGVLINFLDRLGNNITFKDIFSILKGGLIAGFTVSFTAFTLSLTNNLNAISDAINGVFMKKGLAGNFRSVAESLLILAASLFVMGSIDIENLTAATAALSLLMAQVKSFTVMINKSQRLTSFRDMFADLFNSFTNSQTASSMIKFAGSILILAIALKTISKIEPDRLFESVEAIEILMLSVVGMSAIMSKTKTQMLKATFGLIEFSIAMVILADAIKILGSMDLYDLIEGVSAFTVVFAELVGASLILTKNESKLLKGSVSLIAFAASMVVLADAIKILGSMELYDLIEGVSAFTVVFAELVGASLILTKNESKMLAGSVSLIAFAASMAVLASAIKTLGSMELYDLIEGVSAFTVVFAELIGASLILTNNESKLLKGSAALLAFSASMVVLASAIKTLGSMDLYDLIEGVSAFTVVLAELVGASLILTKNESKMLKGSINLIAFAASMAVLADAIKTLGSMDLYDLIEGVSAFTVVLAELVGASLLLSNNESKMLAGSAALLVLALALDLLIPIITVFSSLSWDTIFLPIVGFVGILGSLVGAITLLSGQELTMLAMSAAILAFGTGCALVGVGITALATGIGLLVGIILDAGESIMSIIYDVLGLLPAIGAAIAKTIVSIAEIIGDSMPLLILSFVKIIDGILDAVDQSFPRVLESVLSIINSLRESAPKIVNALLDLIIKILEALNQRIGEIIDLVLSIIDTILASIRQKFEGLDLITLFGVEAFIATMALLVKGLSKLKADVKDAAIVAALIVGLTASITLILAALSSIGAIDVLIISASLAGLVGAMAGVITLLAKLKVDVGSAVNAALALVAASGIIIGGFAAILLIIEGIFGLIATIDGSKEFFQNGINLLIMMADGIGRAFGALVDGFLNQATQSIPEIGTRLSIFMENLSGFLAGLQTITPDMSTAAKTLAELILTLSVADLIDGVSRLLHLGGDDGFENLGTKLSSFADTMIEFSAKTSALTPEAISKAKIAAEVGMAMAELAKSIPAQGGWIQKIAGTKDLGDFGEKVKKYVEAINEVAGTLISDKGSINESSKGLFIIASDIGVAMNDLANSVPKTGGIWQKIAGVNDLEDFGNKVKAYAEAINTVAGTLTSDKGAINDSTPKLFEIASEAGEKFLKLQNTLPKTGGIWQKIAGSQDISDFGAKVVTFGEKLVEFQTTVKDIDYSKVGPAITIIERLTGIQIPEKEGFFNLSNLIDYADFVVQMQNLGLGLQWFDFYTKNLDYESIEKALTQLYWIGVYFSNINAMDFTNSIQFVESLKTLGETSAMDFTTALEGKIPDVSESAGKLYNAVIVVFNKLPEDFAVIAAKVAKEFNDAFSSTDSSVINSAEGIKQTILDQVESLPEDMKTLGENTVTEFTKGFSENFNKISETSSALATVVSELMTNAIEINSFAENIEGFADAMVYISDKAGELNNDAIVNLLWYAWYLSQLSDGETYGLFAFFTGKEDNLSDFGDNIKKFADDFVEFGKKIKKVDGEAIVTGMEAIQQVVDKFKEIDSLNMESVGSFSAALSNIAKTSIDDFTKEFTNAQSDVDDAVQTLYSSVIAIMEPMPSDFMDFMWNSMINFIGTLQYCLPGVETICQQLADTCKGKIDGISDDFKSEAEMSVSQFMTGLNNKKSELGTKVRELSTYSANQISNYTAFYQTGQWTGQGFIDGIWSKNNDAQIAAWWVGYNAVESLRNGTKVQSPSKLTREVGQYFGEGFIYGISDEFESVNKTSDLMGKLSVEALTDAIEKVANVVNDDLEINPVITPVLDLSDIQNGVTGINGLLDNGNYQLGSLSGRLASNISLGGNIEQTNPVYNDAKVLSAIDTLGARVDNLNEAISNMRVILDSGEVVGGIANKMNKRFSEMEFAVARGVR